jgi:hypothetical protein
MPCCFRLLDGQLVGVISPFAGTMTAACCPLAGLAITAGLT